jgi:hypothetical protein
MLEAPPAVALPHIATEFAAPATPVMLVRPRCEAGKPGEIVVCASDPKRYRLEPLADSQPNGMPKAEARLSRSATIDIHTEQAMIGGAPSNRAMIGLKIGL